MPRRDHNPILGRSVATSAFRVRAGGERRELPATREARAAGRSSVLSYAWLMGPRKRAGFHRPKSHDRAPAVVQAPVVVQAPTKIQRKKYDRTDGRVE